MHQPNPRPLHSERFTRCPDCRGTAIRRIARGFELAQGKLYADPATCANALCTGANKED